MSQQPQSRLRRRNRIYILRLEERIERIEERLNEMEFLPVAIDGEIISFADYQERNSPNY